MSKVVSWINPTARNDGTAFNAQSETAGYEIQLDGAGQVSVPNGYATSFDLATLSVYDGLKHGTHSVAVDVVAKDGSKSVFSQAASFQVVVAPLAPTNLQVAAS